MLKTMRMSSLEVRTRALRSAEGQILFYFEKEEFAVSLAIEPGYIRITGWRLLNSDDKTYWPCSLTKVSLHLANGP